MARKTSPKKYSSSSGGNLFKTLEYEAFRKGITPRSKESMDWFRKKAHTIRRIDRKQLMKDEDLLLKDRTIVGNMFMYFYDPKHKKTLPYYDSFPLSIIMGPAEGGFYGLNLHYLPPLLRAKFLDSLMDVKSNNKYDESTKFKITYEMLKSATKYKYFKPCFKHYLSKHVRSRFALVSAPEWEIATFLPTADWQKSSATNVYKESRMKL